MNTFRVFLLMTGRRIPPLRAATAPVSMSTTGFISIIIQFCAPTEAARDTTICFLSNLKNGSVVYSVFKENDYGTALRGGNYENTALARAFETAVESGNDTDGHLTDFSHYLTSYGLPASFISHGIYDEGVLIGVLVLQISIEEIYRVMTSDMSWNQEGMGETGETYLLGEDLLMRSNSRFFIEDSPGFIELFSDNLDDQDTAMHVQEHDTTILQISVVTEASRLAASGERGIRIIEDYR